MIESDRALEKDSLFLQIQRYIKKSAEGPKIPACNLKPLYCGLVVCRNISAENCVFGILLQKKSAVAATPGNVTRCAAGVPLFPVFFFSYQSPEGGSITQSEWILCSGMYDKEIAFTFILTEHHKLLYFLKRAGLQWDNSIKVHDVLWISLLFTTDSFTNRRCTAIATLLVFLQERCSCCVSAHPSPVH